MVVAKIEKGLLPLLENYANRASQIDLQDIFQRFTFDCFCRLFLDHDPGSLSLELPYIRAQYAFSDGEKAILRRHWLPETCWKLQKWFGIGKEGKLTEAWDEVDQFIYPCIEKKLEKLTASSTNKPDGIVQLEISILNSFIQAYKSTSLSSKSYPKITKTFIRDAFLSLLAAGKDTISTSLSWFFFLLAKNPLAKEKILHEIQTKISCWKHDQKEEDHHCHHPWNLVIFSLRDAEHLVYLHAALCETRRLHSPVALNHKAPRKSRCSSQRCIY
ncbi:OLC1v1035361C1 [Oldenlandia corymbosa var. corymbosa]|uniref:OLC1v1035361C1 n=1 Tax=Oldenlandia corymbosa var. corymbosa TaxID=529605 RepID=A0AAV1CTP0_OLDCO|nr:OLC1v1035361C1 [Oldenlandia corymbosa var. corymbosa]